MKIANLKNKKILILGYGIEGHETEKFLRKHLGKSAIIEIGDKALDKDYLIKQKNFDLAIKSPGIHKSKVKIPYTTATNIFFSNAKGIIIGITGTKGKSTTTALIYNILKNAFGDRVHLLGNITHKLTNLGKPLLSSINDMNKNDQIFVCELSSFQLDDLKKSPNIAVFTSFFPEHMDFHGNVKNYFNAKKNITKFQTKEDFFIYNPRFKELKTLAKQTKAKSIPFNDKYKIKNTNLVGVHNLENIKIAVTVAKILKIDDDIIKKTIANFNPLPHRLEKIGEYKKIIFYDDAISTTPQSTIAAIKALKNIGIIFLGGQDRGYDFKELAQIIIKYKIPNLVIFPESGKKILELIKYENEKNKSLYFPKILETKLMNKAVKFAFKNAKTGQIVLLSNASPSYSLWKNFEEKAKEFRENIEKINAIKN